MKETLFNLGKPILNDWTKIAQHLLPGLCLLCGTPATKGNLCQGCRDDLPYLPRDRCPRCAAPSHAGAVCGACLQNPPEFDLALAPCAYAHPLDRAIQSFKFASNLAAAPMLADLMLTEIRATTLPDLIVPMPLSRERLRERGFNQSLEIARIIAVEIGVVLDPEVCRRIQHGAAQSALAWDERAKNIRGAFVCVDDLHGRSVAVVDDVLTTGSTLNEIARVLRKRGATQVIGWIAARTLGRS
jgi:ComF family protein